MVQTLIIYAPLTISALLMVVPFPSCPDWFCPQHWTVPFPRSAQVCRHPALTSTAPAILASPTPQAATTPPPAVPPAVHAHMFKQQHPFIAMGLDIASGKSTPG